MAPFNPEINPVKESYISRSQGISVPDNLKPTGQDFNNIQPRGIAEGNKAAEYAGKAEAAGYQLQANEFDKRGAIVNAVDTGYKYGVTITDKLIKDQIERDVYDQANAEREGYITELQGLKDKLSGPGPKLKSFLDANAQDTGDDLPDEIQDFSETADRLAAAREQGATPGRQRSTGYATKLVQVAKNLRSKYPGYKEYVDQQMEKVTGHKSANYQMAQLIGDINAKMGSQDAATKRTLSFAQQNIGFLSMSGKADEIIAGVQSGQYTLPDIVKMIAPYAARRTKNEMLKWQREDVDNGRHLAGEKLEGLATDEVDSRINTMSGEAIDKFNIDIGLDKPVKFTQFADEAKAGKHDPQLLQAAGQQLSMQIPIMRQHMMAEGNARNPKTRRTLIQDAGGLEKFKGKVEIALEPFKEYQTAWYDGKFGITGSLTREMTAKNDMLTARMQLDPNIGPSINILKALKGMGADGLLNDTFLEIMRGGFDEHSKAFISRYAGEFMAGTAASKTGTNITFNSFLTDARKNSVDTNAVTSHVFNDIMTKLKKSNVSPDIKMNLVASMYGDGNLNFVEKLNKDGVDSKGRPILGQYYTYNQMTAPEVTEQIKELDKVRPGAWNKYVNWATTTYRNLFVRELKDFESSYDTLKGRGITVDWIKETGEFRPRFPLTWLNEAKPAEFGLRDTANIMKDKVKSQFFKLNDGLKGLRNIAVAAGKSPDDVETFMLDAMANSGWRPSADIGGLPEKMMQKLIASKMAEEAKKASRKKIEEEAGKR